MGMSIDLSLLYERYKRGYNKGFKDGIKGSIPKDQYENRLKADMVAMLTEIKKEIDEIPINADNSEPFRLGQASAYDKCENLIQEKINQLKG